MWIVAVLAASQPACPSGATTTTRFNSRVVVAHAAPVKRLLVFESVERPGFGHDMHQGFVVALTKRLSMCGVTARLLQADASEVDPAARVAKNIQEFQADAVLLIRGAGGSVVNGGSGGSELIFELKLIETASQRMTWQAKSEFVRSGTDSFNNTDRDTDSGATFGTSIVSRLRDDRVLTECPALPTGWPELRPGPAA
jgi:hypothetical protein